MKKLLPILILFLFSVAVVSAQTAISNCAQLAAVNSSCGADYYLTANIDGSCLTSPLCPSGYSGDFDGDDFYIKDIALDEATNLVGLFARLTSAGTITNLTVVNSSFKGVNQVGALVGSNEGKITFCGGEGNYVEGAQQVAGLAGHNKKIIYDSYSIADVNSSNGYAGGLVGYLTGGNAYIERCYAAGSVTSTSSRVGGLVGRIYHGYVEDSYSEATVYSSSSYVGGLVGHAHSDSFGDGLIISNCYATGDVTADGGYVGGLVGQLDRRSTSRKGRILDSYATGNVSPAGTYSGGLVGHNRNSRGYISASYWNNHTGNPAICVGNGGVGSGGSCTPVQDDETHFYNPVNSPMDEWDFLTTPIWGLIDTNSDGDGEAGVNHSCLIWESDCSQAPVVCGNSLIELGEECDDGNNVSGDGCDSDCQIESGYVCQEAGVPCCELMQQDGDGYYNLTECCHLNLIGTNHSSGDNYKLIDDLDCSSEVGRNGNVGEFWINNFFSGIFDGRNNTINGINVTTTGRAGFIFRLQSAVVKNLGIVNSTIKGGLGVGGISYEVYSSTIERCYFEGEVISTSSAAGGIIGGVSSANIRKSFFVGKIEGKDYVGGIFGTGDSAVVDDCYVNANVSGNDYVGGITGSFQVGGGGTPILRKVYFEGSVTGNNSVGGIAGETNRQIHDSFSTALVNGDSAVGGLVGNLTGRTVINSYWFNQAGDTATSCCGNVEAVANCSDCYAETPLSYFYTQCNEPMLQWDFNVTPIWGLEGGQADVDYPCLMYEDGCAEAESCESQGPGGNGDEVIPEFSNTGKIVVTIIALIVVGIVASMLMKKKQTEQQE